MVPNGWVDGRVGDVVLGFESGVSVNGENRPLTHGEKGVLKVSAVSYGKFNPLAAKAIAKSEVSQAKTSPKAGQIIISRSNTEELVGASAYVEADFPDLFLPDKLWQTVPKPSTNTKWLSYSLSSEHARYTLSKLATGTSGSMKNITQSELLSLRIIIPPQEEQSKIAIILTSWDKAITTTEQLLANSRSQKQALMQQLLTGKKRLSGYSTGWQSTLLGKAFKERVETGLLDLPLLSITSEEGVINREDTGRKDTSNADKSKYLRICQGDIGYNTMRMWQGVSGLSKLEGLVSPAYTVLTPQQGIDPLFAAYLFKLPALVHIFYRYSQGLVSDTWNLKYAHFAKIKWSIPALEEQKSIAAVLASADQEIEHLQRKLTCLQQEKKALMQQLLTGKRRVKLDAKEEAI